MLEFESVEAVRDFLETGGDVLLLIGLVTLAMWTLMLERMWFYWRIQPGIARRALQEWDARSDRSSWGAHQIRRLMISEVQIELNASLLMIKTLVALCPLLGLLGTVWGMIEVFNIMAVTGGGDAKSMAGGVQRATIPTMAGMVAALSGVFGNTYITRIAQREGEFLQDNLTTDH